MGETPPSIGSWMRCKLLSTMTYARLGWTRKTQAGECSLSCWSPPRRTSSRRWPSTGGRMSDCAAARTVTARLGARALNRKSRIQHAQGKPAPPSTHGVREEQTGWVTSPRHADDLQHRESRSMAPSSWRAPATRHEPSRGRLFRPCPRVQLCGFSGNVQRPTGQVLAGH